LPAFIEPCLATVRDKVPSGEAWLHEIKFDGYRLQLHKADNDVCVFTRRGHNWSKRFPSIVEAAWYLPASHLILDGEVVVITNEGHSDFTALEADLRSGRSDRFAYYVFDILHINSTSMRDCALNGQSSLVSESLSNHRPYASRYGNSVSRGFCDCRQYRVAQDVGYRAGPNSYGQNENHRHRDPYCHSRKLA
jgi:bifunctional non-homologous end joining protein LigD